MEGLEIINVPMSGITDLITPTTNHYYKALYNSSFQLWMMFVTVFEWKT
jgi:hypothetical protein